MQTVLWIVFCVFGGFLHCVCLQGQMGSRGAGLRALSERCSHRGVEMCTTDGGRRLTQVINAMRMEIRKLELENMGLRRTAGASLRKSATVPIMTPECRESVVMTVRRYSIFQPLVNQQNGQLDDDERWTRKTAKIEK